MMKHLAYLLLSLALASPAMAQGDTVRVMPAKIQVDSTDPLVSAYKAEAGLALAFDLAPNYSFIPTAQRDSLLREAGQGVNIGQAALTVGAQAVVFNSTKRFVNLVRSEINLAQKEGYTDMGRGIGYALVRYRKDSVLVVDPAILRAHQRALCAATGNDSLYADADSTFRVFPTSLVAIGGIHFKVDSTADVIFDLFESSIIVSYNAAMVILHELQNREYLTMVDVETRDSMFATAGLLGVENDRPSSFSEARILKLFEVDYLITGTFQMQTGSKGADLELVLNRIEADGKLTPIRRGVHHVGDDALSELKDALLSTLEEVLPRGAGSIER